MPTKKEKTTKKGMRKAQIHADSAHVDKEAVKKKPVKKVPLAPTPKPKKYYEAVGRRKTAIARVRLFTIKPFEEDEGKITVNDKSYKQYFSLAELQQTAEASLRKLKSLNRFEIVARVSGGGIHAQAEALRHGIARTLVKFNADFRKKLKRAGYLKRDPRMKERKKYGLKAARRAPQWAKR